MSAEYNVTYIGESTPRQCDYRLTANGEELNPRLDLRNHSPTGLSWGYLGSGPAQAALAILAHATGNDALALKHYQTFKAEVIALQPENFTLTRQGVVNWVREKEKITSHI